jgi:uncharacterized membrane protein
LGEIKFLRTPASVKSHPYHVFLVALPIGLWVFSLYADLTAHFRWGREVWRAVAYYTLAGGIITALLAAVPGFIDLLSIHDAKLKRIGIFHMTINLVVVGLYVVNLLLRRGGASEEVAPIILSALGVVLLGISGWLGGELVHRYRVGVQEPGPDARPA